MQTKEQVREKVHEMMMGAGFLQFIINHTNHLLDSGAINFEDLEDDYVLPKAILSVSLESLADQYTLEGHIQTQRLKANLRRF